MEVILLERTQNLGNVGDLVNVKNGYARNYLIPQEKALRATEENKREFEAQRAEIEAVNTSKKKEAEVLSAKIEGQFLILTRQAGEDGRLYGSVSTKDVAISTTETTSVEVVRSQVVKFAPIKTLGVYTISIALHPEVIANVNVNVARTAGEAEAAKKEFLNPTKKEEEAFVEVEAATADAVSEEAENAEPEAASEVTVTTE